MFCVKYVIGINSPNRAKKERFIAFTRTGVGPGVKTDSHSDVTNAAIVHVVCCREGRLCLKFRSKSPQISAAQRRSRPEPSKLLTRLVCDNAASMSTPANVRSVAVLGTNRHPIHFLF